MKPDQEVIAQAVRVEEDSKTGEVFLTFKITSTEWKRKILREWHKPDLEFIIDGKNIRTQK